MKRGTSFAALRTIKKLGENPNLDDEATVREILSGGPDVYEKYRSQLLEHGRRTTEHVPATSSASVEEYLKVRDRVMQGEPTENGEDAE